MSGSSPGVPRSPLTCICGCVNSPVSTAWRAPRHATCGATTGNWPACPSSGRPSPQQSAFPAIYCRHCGRSGWGVGLAAVGSTLDSDDTAIRRNHAAREGRFRALIYAPQRGRARPGARCDRPARTARPSKGCAGSPSGSGCCCRPRPQTTTRTTATAGSCRCSPRSGLDADDDSRDDTCPSCQQKDGIRFLGSAIATLLSVTLSTMFGDEALDPAGEEGARLHRQRAGRRAPRRVRGEPLAYPDAARAAAARGRRPAGLARRAGRPGHRRGGRRPVPAVPDHPARPRRAERVRAVLAA